MRARYDESQKCGGWNETRGGSGSAITSKDENGGHEVKTILVTGGLGFIGSNFIRMLLQGDVFEKVINLDKQTYAGNPENLSGFQNHPRYVFQRGDICDQTSLESILMENEVDAVVNFAAESHVDRSIDGPEPFVQTNIVGTLRLLEATKTFLSECKADDQKAFRFLHVSTDEVYGDILKGRTTEKYPYYPSSPYAASKAASDHLVSSYVRTYKIPAIITNCSNNYGPKQHPEKLIPKLIYNILNNKPLPIYGKGTNSREWIYVKDHCEALLKIFTKGKIGQFYNIGSNKNLNNLQVSQKLIKVSKNSIKLKNKVKIIFVKDRPGHDIRYALNSNKIKRELKWKPVINFKTGIKLTFDWYNKNIGYFKRISKKDITKRLGNK